MTVPAPVFRRLGEADADDVLAVAVACDVADMGEPDTDRSDVLRDLRTPGAQWFGVDGATGALAAYGCAARLPGHLAVAGDVRVAPGADPALGPPLLARVRAAAAGIDPARPLHVFVHVGAAARREWCTAAGGRPVRHFWRMVADLRGAEPAAPVPPAGAAIRGVADTDADKRLVAHLVHTSFREHFGHDPAATPSYDDFVHRTHGLAGFDLRLWWVATVDGEPAAALMARQLPDTGFVNTLGTLAEFRGRGLGRALLRTAFAEFRRRDLPRAMLGVDASNPTGAVRLYESVGMHAEQEWVVYELPPG